MAGYNPPDAPLPWTLANRQGGRTRSLRRARLFPFDPSGHRAALDAARALRDAFAPGMRFFTARVVLSGRPSAPDDVVEAWQLEGRPEPQDIGPYPFA